MAISFKWQNNAYNQTAATSAALSTGGSISAGDLLIGVVGALNSSTDPGAITIPSGFTALSAGGISGNAYSPDGVRRAYFYKIATGSEGTTFSASWTNPDVYSWALLNYSGVNTSTPFDGGAQTEFNGTYSSNIIAPAITTSVPNDWEICIWSFGAGGTLTMPAGMTTRLSQAGSSSGAPWIGVADVGPVAAGAQATQTVTYQYTVNTWDAISIGIQPASGGGSPTDDIAPRSGAMTAIILMRERASGLLEPVRELWRPKRPRVLVPGFAF